jgi:MtrB/PioB family decaheme-associated outer membrane protein
MNFKLKLIPLLVANLFTASAVLAADDDFTWSGEVEAGARGISNGDGVTRNGVRSTATATTTTAPSAPVIGPKDGAKFTEYRDLKSGGLIGDVDVKGGNNRNYVRFFGENFGRLDQYLNVEGGQYGNFKYRLYDDKMLHNFSNNVLTPFSGAGSNSMTGPTTWNINTPADPNNNPANWNSINEGWKRNNYGGHFELQANSPWYIRADANEITTKGVRPMSAPLTQSAGNGYIELPTPVDYRTRNLSLEGGYSSKQGLINVSILRSQFNNNTESMAWRDPFYSGASNQTSLLPPDSEQTKVGVNGAWRQLPLHSTLMGRYSYNRLTDNLNLNGLGYDTNLTGNNGVVTSNPPTSRVFSGKIITQSFYGSLTSAPINHVDTKLYASWYDKKNDSTAISYLNAPPATTVALAAYPNSVGYRKSEAGFDVGYRYNTENKVSGGYQWMSTVRTALGPAVITGVQTFLVPTTTTDNRYYLEYKNSSLDYLTGRLKYEYINRRSKDYPGVTGVAPALQNPAQTSSANPTWNKLMDVADFGQDRVKLVLDANPIDMLALGFEAILKHTNYDSTPYGMKSDNRHEYNVNASYGNADVFRVTAFYDWESIKFDDNWYVGSLPNATPNTYAGDFRTKQKSTNKMFGLSADWPIMAKLMLNGSYIWSKTGGGVDFTNSGIPAANTALFNGALVPFVTDNTTKHSLNLKGKYTIDKHWAVTGGYTWEKYDYRDDQMNGFAGNYPYYMSLGATQSMILSGAFQNPSYKAQVFYLMGSYKFD